MQIRHKYFPYPVISEDNDSYENSSFITDTSSIKDGYNIKLILKSNVDNPTILKMIDKEELEFVHHIECSQTCYRMIVKTFDEKCEHTIPDNRVNGLIQVCSFIVATKDILNYSCSLFSSD